MIQKPLFREGFFIRVLAPPDEEQKLYFVRKVGSALWNPNNKTIGILGLAFKSDTDDMRYAPSIDIIEALQKEGAKIQAYDPQSMAKSRPLFKNVRFTDKLCIV